MKTDIPETTQRFLLSCVWGLAGMSLGCLSSLAAFGFMTLMAKGALWLTSSSFDVEYLHTMANVDPSIRAIFTIIMVFVLGTEEFLRQWRWTGWLPFHK